MKPFIAINANDIDQAGLPVERELPEAWLTELLSSGGDGDDEAIKATAPGHLVGRLSRSGKADIVIRSVVDATVSVPCARCLKPVAETVRAELSLLLKPAATPPRQKATDSSVLRKAAPAPKPSAERTRAARATTEYEFTSDEADLDEYDGETVVLDGFVREAILLELPNFPLCSEACPGISAPPLANGGSSKRNGASGPVTFKANPFEALKHLRPTLTSHAAETTEGSSEADEAAALLSRPPIPRPKKSETKIASTHTAPRRPAAKKTGRSSKRTKRT